MARSLNAATLPVIELEDISDASLLVLAVLSFDEAAAVELLVPPAELVFAVEEVLELLLD